MSSPGAQQSHAMASAINAYSNATNGNPLGSQVAKGILGLGIGSIPIVGSLASTLLNYGLDSLKIAQQNRYNSPERELQRLSRAGLPGAAYMHGMGNTQQNISGASFDPTIGTQQGVQQYLQDRFQKQQLELMQADMRLREQQIRNVTYGADIKGGERNWMLSGDPITGGTNQARLLQLGRQLKVMQQWVGENRAYGYDLDNALKSGMLQLGIPFRKGLKELEVMSSNISVNDARKLLMSKQMDKITRDIALSFTREEKLKSEIGLNLQNQSIRQLQERIRQTWLNAMIDPTTGLIRKEKLAGASLMEALPFVSMPLPW